jgi:hypothetical protein
MKTSNRLLTLLPVLAIALAACGGESSGTDPGIAAGEPDPSGPALGMCAPDAPDCNDVVVQPGDGRLVPGYRPVGVEGDVPGDGLPVAGERLIGADGNRLDIGFSMGADACYAVEAVDVIEADDRVTVDIIVAPREPGRACIAIAEARSVSVELAAPLGDRSLEVGGVTLAG